MSLTPFLGMRQGFALRALRVHEQKRRPYVKKPVFKLAGRVTAVFQHKRIVWLSRKQ